MKYVKKKDINLLIKNGGGIKFYYKLYFGGWNFIKEVKVCVEGEKWNNC